MRVVVAGAFARAWLERSFHHDLVAAAQEVVDATVTVDWVTAETAPETMEPSDGGAAGPAGVVAMSAGVVAASHGSVVIAPVPPGGARATVGAASVGVGRTADAGIAAAPGTRLAEFVVGAGNRMAWTAVEMALARPGQASPLVIVGPGGCGKTHLVEGLCERVRHRVAVGAVVCCSSCLGLCS